MGAETMTLADLLQRILKLQEGLESGSGHLRGELNELQYEVAIRFSKLDKSLHGSRVGCARP
jgi:hypothetical protein